MLLPLRSFSLADIYRPLSWSKLWKYMPQNLENCHVCTLCLHQLCYVVVSTIQSNLQLFVSRLKFNARCVFWEIFPFYYSLSCYGLERLNLQKGIWKNLSQVTRRMHQKNVRRFTSWLQTVPSRFLFCSFFSNKTAFPIENFRPLTVTNKNSPFRHFSAFSIISKQLAESIALTMDQNVSFLSCVRFLMVLRLLCLRRCSENHLLRCCFSLIRVL